MDIMKKLVSFITLLALLVSGCSEEVMVIEETSASLDLVRE
jgi:PBP1b-binding outer membrane lipoprotein LpoB